MTTQVTPFVFESHFVRTTQINGEQWYIASDVTNAIGIDRTQTRRLDDDEKGVCSIHTPSGDQEMLVINESGLYSLILRSRKPEAKRFKRWVTHEVLPSIRKTGQYAPNGSTLSDHDMSSLLNTLSSILWANHYWQAIYPALRALKVPEVANLNEQLFIAAFHGKSIGDRYATQMLAARRRAGITNDGPWETTVERTR